MTARAPFIQGLTFSFAFAFCAVASVAIAAPKKPARSPKPPRSEAAVAAEAAPTSITVTVFEIAGTQAYLQPGETAGVGRGATVTIDGHRYRVVQTTSTYAVVDVGDSPLREGDRGHSSVVAQESSNENELPAPHPPRRGSMPVTPAPPAASQTPTFVPLGGAERDRRWDVRLSTVVGGILPFGGGAGIARAEINARVHAEPMQRPLAFDLDVSVQRWFAAGLDARQGGSTRSTVWLREALLGYGAQSGYYAGFGRMRYAASTLGSLDGVRAQAPLGAGVTLGAFGGVLPHPLSAEPSLDAQRFGLETRVSRPDLALRPEAALVLHGSNFAGNLDERRASGMFGIYPGRSRVGGHFEISNFDKDNPWKASPIELTAAGLDGSMRLGVLQLGARADVRQPVRSRWLASLLPASWFCRTVAAAPGTPEPCDGSVSMRAMGAVDAGVEVGTVTVTVGGTAVTDVSQTGGAPDMLGAFAAGRVVRIAGRFHVDVSGNYSQATYLTMVGGSAGPGVSLFSDVLDVSAYYRNATLTYRSVDTSYVQHGVGGTVMLFPTGTVLFTVQAEGIVGDDTNALLVFGTAMWRPRL